MIELAGVMLVVMVFVFGLVGGLTWISARGLPKARPVDPEQLLRERFAKGEITEEEYARRLSILKYGPPIELL